MTRYVLIPRFCALTGYTEKAVRRKMQSGVWIEGREWKKAPDGHVFLDCQSRTRWRNQPKTKRSSFSRRSASSM